jgi:riboflavin biosynthesis pyrimidine reductase
LIPIRTLFSAETAGRASCLSKKLRGQYGGDLCFPRPSRGRPYVIANFVSTLDGIVSFNLPGQSGGASISGSNQADRFIMGLLRASADAVIVGAATVEAVSRAGLWTAEFAYPPAKELYMRYRLDVLKKPEHPLVVVVTGTGSVDLRRAIFRARKIPVVILTTENGKRKLELAGSGKLPSTTVHVMPAGKGRIAPSAILDFLSREYRLNLLLHEGGPTLFGDFLSAGCVDELFLTLSPQIAGKRGKRLRPSLGEGVAFTPATAPWLSLLSVKQAQNHLYLRYRKRS